MYLPEHFVSSDPQTLYPFIAEHSFAVLMSSTESVPIISRAPIFLELHPERPRLLAHLAKANPHLDVLARQPDLLLLFTGPHAYVSPSWYENSGVPTWNYADVTVTGRATLIHDTEGKREIVDQLTEVYERPRQAPWVPDYPDTMLNAIVGLEIEILAMQGKFKLSQNKSDEDRRRVQQALSQSDHFEDQRVGALMQTQQQG